MSSEYSIHLGDKPIECTVWHLDVLPSAVARIRVSDAEKTSSLTQFVLYIPEDRLAELSLLFHKIALELGELANAYADDIGAVPATIPTEDAAEAVEPPHRWG